MKYKKGDLIVIPEDKYSPEETVIITGTIEEDEVYVIYNVSLQMTDFYLFDLLDSIGNKIG